MKKKYSVAIVGATGAVGSVLLQVLAERKFPIGKLHLFASEKSRNKKIAFLGNEISVQELNPSKFSGIDFIFFAGTGSLSEQLAPEAAKRGAIVIDKSSTWRMNPDVPLVVPEVNSDALKSHQGIISCPNCTTIAFVMALEPIRKVAGLKHVIVTTMQAVSGAGKKGLAELANQKNNFANSHTVFPARIYDNVIPMCEKFFEDTAYTTEELKLLHETRKILSMPELQVSMTCVRVPVTVGHSASIYIETESPLSVREAEKALSSFPGVRVCISSLATPEEARGQNDVLVSRIRKDLQGNGIWLWTASDNLRKGAATNAVQIAEHLIK
jgi:aspartate-semialdehyde dehydrogenase